MAHIISPPVTPSSGSIQYLHSGFMQYFGLRIPLLPLNEKTFSPLKLSSEFMATS